jgi:hypothetical protein
MYILCMKALVKAIQKNTVFAKMQQEGCK